MLDYFDSNFLSSFDFFCGANLDFFSSLVQLLLQKANPVLPVQVQIARRLQNTFLKVAIVFFWFFFKKNFKLFLGSNLDFTVGFLISFKVRFFLVKGRQISLSNVKITKMDFSYQASQRNKNFTE